ncbi:MAG: hypothetical protein ACI81T_004273 [Bacteroidia bacterium]|jgi:hypothetical protein
MKNLILPILFLFIAFGAFAQIEIIGTVKDGAHLILSQ